MFQGFILRGTPIDFSEGIPIVIDDDSCIPQKVSCSRDPFHRIAHLQAKYQKGDNLKYRFSRFMRNRPPTPAVAVHAVNSL